jgi:hypothetical protein
VERLTNTLERKGVYVAPVEANDNVRLLWGKEEQVVNYLPVRTVHGESTSRGQVQSVVARYMNLR